MEKSCVPFWGDVLKLTRSHDARSPLPCSIDRSRRDRLPLVVGGVCSSHRRTEVGSPNGDSNGCQAGADDPRRCPVARRHDMGRGGTRLGRPGTQAVVRPAAGKGRRTCHRRGLEPESRQRRHGSSFQDRCPGDLRPLHGLKEADRHAAHAGNGRERARSLRPG